MKTTSATITGENFTTMGCKTRVEGPNRPRSEGKRTQIETRKKPFNTEIG